MSELNNPFLVGKICYLRALTENDLEGDYFQWLNNYEVTRFLETGRYPNTPGAMRRFLESVQTSDSRVLLAVCDNGTNKHIGNVSLREIHYVHRRAEFGIMIGDTEYGGKGYATEATFLMVDYGFRRLNLNSIYLGVLVDHPAAVRVYEKVGFRVDGREREAWWADGTYHDMLRMSILAREHFARLENRQR